MAEIEEVRKKILDSFRDWTVPLFLVAVFAISMYLMITDYSRKNAQSAAEEDIQAVFENYVEHLTSHLDQLKAAGETAAVLSGENAARMTEAKNQSTALAVKQVTGSTEVFFSDIDGNAVSAEGEKEKLDLERHTGGAAWKNAGSVWCDFVMESADDEAEIPEDGRLRMFIPVCPEAETDPQAYLICVKDLGDWADDEETSKIKTTYRALVNRNGEGSLLSGTVPEEVRDDIWADLEAETGQKEIVIRKKLSSIRSLSLNAENGDIYYIIPLKTVDSMYLVVKVKEEAVQSKISRQIRKTQSLLRNLELLTAVFIFLYTAYSWLHHNVIVKNREKLEKSATTDPLTGLKNKMTMEREIREYMEQNPDDRGLMFLLDLDNFKTINDTKGHAFGDQVLKEFSFRLSSYFRAADLVGRIGGDEFMVFCPHFSDEAAIAYKIESLENFAKTFSVGTVMIQKVSCSIGLAYYPKDGAEFETLYKAADQAMYRSKKGGKARVSV